MIQRTRPCVSKISAALSMALPLIISGCATQQMTAPIFDQATIPAEVRVPAGHRVMLETVGIGEITYECRTKANMAGQFEWVFVGPDAKLMNRAGTVIGKYYGPPATWEHSDASKLTGAQLAVAPAGAGKIPFQLVKANAATGGMTPQGTGAMMGISYVQRTATIGGVAPSSACDATNTGSKEIVKYQADYIFWQPN